MRRYWLPKESDRGEIVEIFDSPYKHIIQVCRQTIGSRFEVLFGDGKAHLVELIEVSRRRAVGKKIEVRQINPPYPPHIHLCLSLPKFSTFEKVIEKMVELGVFAIHPFVSDLSYLKNLNRISENRMRRWEAVAKAATEQTGRGDLIHFYPVRCMMDVVELIKPSSLRRGIFLYEGETDRTLSQVLRKDFFSTELKEIWVIVGSEGGFSQNEVDRLSTCGLVPVTLGEQILRVETACVAICSVLKYLREESKGESHER